MNTDIIKQRLAELAERKQKAQADLEAFNKLSKRAKIGHIPNFRKIHKEALFNRAKVLKNKEMEDKLNAEFDKYFELYLDDKVNSWKDYINLS